MFHIESYSDIPNKSQHFSIWQICRFFAQQTHLTYEYAITMYNVAVKQLSQQVKGLIKQNVTRFVEHFAWMCSASTGVLLFSVCYYHAYDMYKWCADNWFEPLKSSQQHALGNTPLYNTRIMAVQVRHLPGTLCSLYVLSN